MTHLKRWLTSIIALPLLALLLFKGSLLHFTLLIILVATLALWEYFRIVCARRPEFFLTGITAIGFITGPLLILAASLFQYRPMLEALLINLILTALVALPLHRSMADISEALTRQMLGMVYIPLTLACLVMVRAGDHGVQWIVLFLTVIFCGDTGAYYTGTYLGRHKLCPSVSPGKTIEGAMGGLLANLAGGTLIRMILLPDLPIGKSLLLFLAIGLAGQVGDLFESLFKRHSGVKDSGNLLPGHGGILDRIDAILFAAPVLFMLQARLF